MYEIVKLVVLSIIIFLIIMKILDKIEVYISNNKNRIIKNIEEYDKKEKAGKQKSKVLAKGKKRRAKN
tara:strand:- start:5002 stop:5205 length:204 start_codon:yes stop_codon:yes gene_type:complete